MTIYGHYGILSVSPLMNNCTSAVTVFVCVDREQFPRPEPSQSDQTLTQLRYSPSLSTLSTMSDVCSLSAKVGA